MLASYIICAEISLYILILLTLKTICSSSSTLRFKTQQIILKSKSDQTLSHAASGPSYKKRHLTIEIPSETQDSEENSEFISKYCKYQCFPLLLCNDPKSQLNKIERLTIWFTLFNLETLIASFITNEDPIVVSSVISCLICSPVTFVLSIIFGICLPKGEDFEKKQIFGFAFSWVLMVGAAVAAMWTDVDDIQMLILSCFFIFFVEVTVMEPFRTLVKGIGYLISKDTGLIPKFCESI